MDVRAWPPGPPLALRDVAASYAALVLVLPTSDLTRKVDAADATARDAASDVIAAPTMRARTVREGAVVLVLGAAADETARAAATSVFDDMLGVEPRVLNASVDALRALLWRLCVGVPVAKRAPLSFVRGFERLRAFCDTSCVDMMVETTSPQRPPAPPSLSLSALPMHSDPSTGSPRTARHTGCATAFAESLDESKLRLPAPPSLSLSALPALPDPTQSSPGAFARQRRSFKPLDLGALVDVIDARRAVVSACNSPRTASVAACAALSRIRDHLYVGGRTALSSADIASHNIIAIVNLAAGALPSSISGIEHTLIYAHDSDEEDLLAFIPAVALAVQRARQRGGAVLLHCHRGVSRSPAAAAAVLMCDEGLSASAALRAVRTARPVASPNAGFVRALQRLDDSLRGAAPPRISVLVRLPDDPGDGALALVAPAAAPAYARNHAWAAVVCERETGITVARGPLVHDARWREAMRFAEWLAVRDAAAAHRFGRAQPHPLLVTSLAGDQAAELRGALERSAAQGACK